MRKIEYGEGFAIFDPIDIAHSGKTWGTQARVFSGHYFKEGSNKFVAIKLARTGSGFRETFSRELRILSRLNQEHMAITPVVDCGLIYPSLPMKIDDGLSTFNGMSGQVNLYGNNGLMELHDALSKETNECVPFLALEFRDGLEVNLNEIIVDHGIINYLLPLPDVLSVSKQMMELLVEAHGKNVIYQDSRPIHFYISFQEDGYLKLRVIDWNASAIIEEIGNDAPYKQLDLKAIVANVLFPLFTGRMFKNASIEKRYYTEAHRDLFKKYQIGAWKKNEVERLDVSIRNLLEQTIEKETITTPEQFLEQLQKIRVVWSCSEDSEFVQAVRNLHLAYNHLNESQRLFAKLTEDLFRVGGLSQKKTETERMFLLVDSMKKGWLLYPNQIRKKEIK